MRGNSFGKIFSLTTFGESHGMALGVVIDGMPPRIKVDVGELQKWLERRAPGSQIGVSTRKEPDEPVVLSGIFEGETLGTPIAVIVYNKNQKPEEYLKWKNEDRPGHADRTTQLKYGIRDWRGGGRASGRETVSRVIAGYFASLILTETKIKTQISRIGEISFEQVPSVGELSEILQTAQSQGESLGAEVVICASKVPPGLGEPVFDKLKADLAKAFFSVGGVVGVELGAGKTLASSRGSQVSKDPSQFGGIEGGISNGMDISLKISIKPPSTVGEKAKQGRHDPCLVPRILPVLEAMMLIVLADHYLRQMAYEISK